MGADCTGSSIRTETERLQRAHHGTSTFPRTLLDRSAVLFFDRTARAPFDRAHGKSVPMIHAEDRVTARGSAHETFRYVADLTHLPEWDPGIARVKRIDSGPLARGARFEVVARFGGREVPMTYELVEYDEASLVAELRGVASRVRAVDRIRVTPKGSGAEVHWVADLELEGVLRLTTPVMRRLFARTARKAMNGLRAHLG
jgi:carbon monoxide dehydrogenase subunit G